jgi:hypothetical protein
MSTTAKPTRTKPTGAKARAIVNRAEVLAAVEATFAELFRFVEDDAQVMKDPGPHTDSPPAATAHLILDAVVNFDHWTPEGVRAVMQAIATHAPAEDLPALAKIARDEAAWVRSYRAELDAPGGLWAVARGEASP